MATRVLANVPDAGRITRTFISFSQVRHTSFIRRC